MRRWPRRASRWSRRSLGPSVDVVDMTSFMPSPLVHFTGKKRAEPVLDHPKEFVGLEEIYAADPAIPLLRHPCQLVSGHKLELIPYVLWKDHLPSFVHA